ncbi:MAG: hypothetical protein CVU71_17385 [Deltaproteobacteria bacterium HGW-Deltaproteobacteria-6]|jgi:hypothetical protein|nr:MAG: hypothetical protein CVU71_17385 [Deltaproteobacteria bacterium HGW-Deltaproteobacteria-6]
MAKNEQDNVNQNEAGQETQNIQTRKIRFTEEGVKTQYSSIFNIGFGADEVIFMFGNQSVDPGIVMIESKMAVSLKNAKRFAVTLGNLLRRYEAANGVIDISAPQAATEEKPKMQ